MVTLDSLCDFISPLRPLTSTSTSIPLPSLARSTISHITLLPEELIVKILDWCDFKQVVACQLTCRTLNEVISHSTRLRYKLELSKHGMCDGTSNILGTADKLNLLAAHVTAWRNLPSAEPEKLSLLEGWSAPRAVSGNILVFSKDSNHPDSSAHPPSQGPRHEHTFPKPGLDLLVLRLPSTPRQVEAAQWVLGLPELAGELCIDASQDLLIYVLDCKFYPCTLSTGAVHPLVQHDGCFGLWDDTRRFDVFNLCVCGDYVAAGTRLYFISVWNWKTGELVSDQISEVIFSSFDFLDEHHILYSVSREDSLYVYDLRRGAEQQQQPRKQRETEPVRLRLALSPINRATTTRYIQLRRNALPPTRENPSVIEGSSSPFHADQRERLIVLRVVTSPVERGEEQFELHVPARVLLKHFKVSLQTRDRVLPWSAWCDAAHVTTPRRLPYSVQAHMVTYGMRAVSHPPDWDEGLLYVNSYLPRRKEKAGDGLGTRKAVRLPNELSGKAGVLSILSEDALLCYTLDSSMSTITQAYWYSF